jgi:hypothetical protein
MNSLHNILSAFGQILQKQLFPVLQEEQDCLPHVLRSEWLFVILSARRYPLGLSRSLLT